jgi:hypothetical protein
MLSNTLNVSILGAVGKMLLSSIHEIAASTAAAAILRVLSPQKYCWHWVLTGKRHWELFG